MDRWARYHTAVNELVYRNQSEPVNLGTYARRRPGHAARRAPTAPPSCPPSSMRFEFPAPIRHSRDFRVTFRYIGRSRETDSVYDALRSGARRQSGAEFSEFTLERAAQTPPTTRRRSARGPWPTPVGRFARGVARREKPSVPRPNRSPRGARTCPKLGTANRNTALVPRPGSI